MFYKSSLLFILVFKVVYSNIFYFGVLGHLSSKISTVAMGEVNDASPLIAIGCVHWVWPKLKFAFCGPVNFMHTSDGLMKSDVKFEVLIPCD